MYAHDTCLWNNLHHVRQKPKYFESQKKKKKNPWKQENQRA